MRQILLVLLGCVQVAVATVQLVQPSSLVDKVAEIYGPSSKDESFGVVHATMANFGHITYGQTIIAQIFFPKFNKLGCETFKKEHFTEEGQKALFEDKIDMIVPVIMVQRGDCTFTHKVRNIEKAGASAALILDNKVELTERIVMADDGSGNSIHIPSFLIRRNTGDVISQYAMRPKVPVIVKISIDVHESSSGKALVDLWLSSPFDMTESQAARFGDFVGKGLDSHIDFNINLNTHPMTYLESHFKNETCLSNGKYCLSGNKIGLVPFKDRKKSSRAIYKKDISGQDGISLLNEGLRQKCLVKVLKEGKHADVAQHYFSFLSNFLKRCKKGVKDLAACGDEVYNNMKDLPPMAKITDCVKNSFEKQGDTTSNNVLLEADSEQKQRLGIFLNPSITINNYTYRGELGGKDIFKAVCQTFRLKPDECKSTTDMDLIQRTEGMTSGVVERAEAKDPSSLKGKRHTIIGVLMLAAVILLALQCACLAYIKKRQQTDGSAKMSLQINESLAQYQRLNQGSQAQ